MQCVYCQGKNIIKKGTRQKKHEEVQLYYCKDCEKKFTPVVHKHKTYPLRVILDSITQHNRFKTLQASADSVGEKYGLNISLQNISNWLSDFKEHITFLRMRDFIESSYPKDEIYEETKLFHGQIYDFKYHRAKTECILEEEYRHYKFRALKDFLELSIAECPHSVFRQNNARASRFKGVFNLDGVKFYEKSDNYAVKNTRLIMQAVNNNKLRHEMLQEFMVFNDSVTVAAEVPILLDYDDLKHYRDQLGFEIPDKLFDQVIEQLEEAKKIEEETEDQEQRVDPREQKIENGEENYQLEKQWMLETAVITGHIDLIQIRNGSIYIMDFKPSAKKEQPIDQLMIYALAMSRLTGIRLYHFRCAWFDKDHYFEFFPLHVVHKKKSKGEKTSKKRGKS